MSKELGEQDNGVINFLVVMKEASGEGNSQRNFTGLIRVGSSGEAKEMQEYESIPGCT